MAYDREKGDAFLKKVSDKIEASAKKYNDNAYMLADIPKEIEEELIDIVGWPLLEVLRIKEIMAGKIANLEDIYWQTFLPRQSKEFLCGLMNKCADELANRGMCVVVERSKK